MKKLNYFLGLLGLSAIMFTGCGEVLNQGAVDPIISLTSGASVNAAVGDMVTISWRADAGDSKLKSVSILKDGLTPIVDNSGTTWNEIDIPNSENETYADDVTIEAKTVGTINLTIVVKDNSDLTASVDVTITVTNGTVTVEINSWTSKVLGSYSAAEGSSYASVDGTVMTSSQASANSNKVDFVFFYGSSNAATLAAPTDSDLATVFTGVSGWNTKNATKLAKTALSESDFNGVSDEAALLSKVGTPSYGTKANTLAVGSVVAFETASTSANASKKGLILVKAITGTGGTATMSIEVKVQK